MPRDRVGVLQYGSKTGWSTIMEAALMADVCV